MNTALVVPTLPSTTEMSLIESSGSGSSFTIVPMPVELEKVAFVAEPRNT